MNNSLWLCAIDMKTTTMASDLRFFSRGIICTTKDNSMCNLLNTNVISLNLVPLLRWGEVCWYWFIVIVISTAISFCRVLIYESGWVTVHGVHYVCGTEIAVEIPEITELSEDCVLYVFKRKDDKLWMSWGEMLLWLDSRRLSK